jgi:hypothetical protein
MTTEKPERLFTQSVLIILALTGLAKLAGAMGRAPALDMPHPLLMLSWRWVFLIAATLELIVALAVAFSRRGSLNLKLIAWLGCIFVIYRLGVFWIQAPIPCGCLGALTSKLRLSPRSVDLWMKGALIYMFAGSVLFLLLRLRWGGPRPRPGALPRVPSVASFGIVCVFAACSCSSGASPGANTSPTGQDTIEAFKTFVESRPVITKVVFDHQNLVFPSFLPLPLPALQSATNVHHFQAGWQPGGFLLRQVWKFEDVDTQVTATTSTAGLQFAGRAGRRLWHVVNTNVYYSTQEKNDDYVVAISKNAEQLLSDCLDLGAVGVVERSIRWAGDTFTAKSRSGAMMHGSLEVSNGLPIRLFVGYKDSGFSYVSHYTYSPLPERRLPYGLPNTIFTESLEHKEPTPESVTVLYMIECGDKPLSAAFFEPERFMESEPEEVIATNKALYVIRNGVLVKKLRDLPNPVFSIRAKRFIALSVLAAILLGPVVWFAGRKWTRRTRETNQK